MATLMLENAAGVQMIQAILGYGKPTTTEISTHVTITKRREIRSAIHPAAGLGPRKEGGARVPDSIEPVS